MIYAITGPDRRVVYVGMTRHRFLEQRLVSHRMNYDNEAMQRWFYGLRLAGQRSGIYVLEYVSKREWQVAERCWIRWFRERGELFNVDDGGICRRMGAVIFSDDYSSPFEWKQSRPRRENVNTKDQIKQDRTMSMSNDRKATMTDSS